MQKFDILIIGSGGGTKLVRPAAALGKKVAIIEKAELGGTCLNRGCIPSKMLIHVADFATTLKKSLKFELNLKQGFQLDFKALIERVNQTITDESMGIEPLYEKTPNVQLFKGHARFLEDKVVEVNGLKLTADKIFIATGASAHIPHQLEGLDSVPFMTYDEALKSTKLPKKMLIIGGGYIATELGYFFSALGVDVKFIVRSSMLKMEDKEVQKEFERLFCQQEEVLLGYKSKKITYDKGNYTLVVEDKEGHVSSLESDALLVATGVEPNTSSLGLENTQIQTNKKGYIEINDFLETSVKGVYAFGDVIGRHLFRHTANFEGEYLFDALFKSKSPYPITYPPVPHAVFTHPQVAGVGATEEELEKSNTPYFKGVNYYSDSAMGMALLPEGGFVKLLFDKRDQSLVGAHIIGDEASNMIHMLIAFMNKGAVLEDILKMIYIHPALPEVVRNAARKAKSTL
ncbi:Mycothione reductase [Chlamydiales bacterium SCGC AB-751-O23]|jgi:mycothione reductase|nr:Mycothione reductase [Chlamydiales bacterium SCGC AB-751-O23]